MIDFDDENYDYDLERDAGAVIIAACVISFCFLAMFFILKWAFA